ncbi:MAG: nitroreductase family protein [Gaiellaceae bacterium MAG52_C11]|nr:nitroreductase family protein [Candidatus Gaiellasilicea maunaloa]
MEYSFVPLRYERPEPAAQLAASRGFLERLSRRRTVRTFSTEPIPFELVRNAIAAAGTAPSGAHQQPWTFVVVSDPELKRQLRTAAEDEEQRNYDGRMSEEWLQALAPLGTDAVKTHLEDAPYVLVVLEQVYGLREDGSKVKHYYARESLGIAVGFLLASLHEAGLVALTHTPSPMGFIRELLGRPVNERPFCVIPVGFPASGTTVPNLERKPLAEIMVLS